MMKICTVMRKKWIALVLAAAITIGFTACSDGGSSGTDTKAQNTASVGSENVQEGTKSGTGTESSGEKNIVIAAEGETGSFDPASNVGRTYWGLHVYCFEGLVQYAQNGELEYRAAESYTVNDDMTVWTFKIKEDSNWNDGSTVTADDFVNTIIRALDPATQSTYADMLFYIEGAEDAYMGDGAIEDVGVKALEEKTLEITLKEPCPYFLKLLFLPVYYPTKSDIATADNEGWDKDTSQYATNGAYYMAEYSSGESFVLKPNEFYYDADKVKLDSITYRFMDDMQARIAAYKTGELDIVGTVPYYIAEEYEGKPDIQDSQSLTSLYTLPNLNVEVLKDVRVRKALALAIDREALSEIMGTDKSPSDHFVTMKMPSTSEEGKLFSETTGPMFEESVEEAQKLLAEAGYPNGEGFPVLTYNYPNAEDDSNAAQILQSQWKENLGIQVDLNALEQQVYLSERRSGNFDLSRHSWTADFSDPMTYLAMYTSYSKQNDNGVNDSTYDDLIAQASGETDMEKREQLLHEAEKVLVSDNFYIIPVYTVDYINLVNPKLSGFFQDFRGLYDYRFVDLEE